MGSALTPGSVGIELLIDCRIPSWCLQKTGELLDVENPRILCQKYCILWAEETVWPFSWSQRSGICYKGPGSWKRVVWEEKV